MKIAKKFEFDAGHRLSKGYQGKCASPHGHRYVVEVELEHNELNQFDMVTDFNDLKPFKALLDGTFDHKFLVWRGDVFGDELLHMESLGLLPAGSTVLMAENPTAEHIARVIFELACQEPAWGNFVSAVTVWESPTSWARVGVDSELGFDIYRTYAAGVAGVRLDEVTPEQRRAAKVKLFGELCGAPSAMKGRFSTDA